MAEKKTADSGAAKRASRWRMFVLEIKAGRVLSHSDQSAQSDAAALVNGSALARGNIEGKRGQNRGRAIKNCCLSQAAIQRNGRERAGGTRWWDGWNSAAGSLCMKTCR